MDDHLEEEMQIMNEREAEGQKVLDTSTFNNLVSELLMPPVETMEHTSSVQDCVSLMQDKGIGSVVVTNGGVLCGIITERDILMKVTGKIDNLSGTKVTEVMTADPIALQANDMIAYVMHNMHVGGFRHVPIINKEGKPISMVSIKDVLSFILDYFPEEVTNITAEPYRGPVSREGA